MMPVILVQRVERAEVVLSSGEVRRIGRGLLVYVGFLKGDTGENLEKVAKKISNLRVFEDERGKMNLSVRDIGGEVLLIPNFTLAADTRKGNRPSFAAALRPPLAAQMFDDLYRLLKEVVRVERGEFGDHMRVYSVNDGPVNTVLHMLT